MGKRLNLLLLIDNYLCNAGATVAITTFMQQWRSMNMGDAYICTRIVVGTLDDDIKNNIILYDGDIKRTLRDKNIDVVDYFFASRSIIKKSLLSITRNAIKSYNKRVVLVTTVCQRPSNKSTLLTANDIVLSDHLVFIDNAAYNDPLYSFIPKSRKSHIYFGGTKEYECLTGKLADKKIVNKTQFVFGRGSTLNKCPKDILEIFDKINVPNKLYKIVGVQKDSWLGLQAVNRKDIEVIPPVPYNDWLLLCSQFDVFLYYLTEDAHSSIDGTLGDAMLMKIPPIVYGPAAPKERIIHGVNGFIANSKEDVINYAELLYNDENLRKKMGEVARSTQIDKFSFEKTIENYRALFDSLLCEAGDITPIKVSMINKLLLFKNKYFFSFFMLIYGAVKIKCIACLRKLR